MHTRPNVYMDEVLLTSGAAGKTAPKFHTSSNANINNNHYHHHQSVKSIISQQDLQQNMNMRNRQRKWRVLLSIGLLLPALAAIIGIVAWTISIEVASANEAISSQKSSNHQNNHLHHSHHHQSQHHSHHPHHQPLQQSRQQQQQQPQPQPQPNSIDQNEQPNKRHLQQQQRQQQQPSIALPQQAAETKSESQACATLVLTNLKQQPDSNSDNIENRASSGEQAAGDDTSSYETTLDEPQQESGAVNQSGSGSTKAAGQQPDDDSSYEAIASAISTTLKSGSGGSLEPSSFSALKSDGSAAATVRRTTGENVADVIDQLVLRRRQAVASPSQQKGRPNMRASRIVVVAPMDESMRARSLTKEASPAVPESKPAAAEQRDEPAGRPRIDHETSSSLGEEKDDIEQSDSQPEEKDTERRSSSSSSEVNDDEPAVDRGEWVPAWPLRREIQTGDDMNIHVSSRPKEARARSRRQEMNPSLAFERIGSLNKQQQQQQHQQFQKASSGNQSPQQLQQQQPKLYSTEQIIREHVMKSKSRVNNSQPVVGESATEKQQQQVEPSKLAVMTMSPPLAAPQQQHLPRHPLDGSRQQQQPPNGLWHHHQPQQARFMDSQQQHPLIRPQQHPQHFQHELIGSSSSHQQQQQVPQFFFQPNQQRQFNGPNQNGIRHPANHLQQPVHLQPPQHQLLQPQPLQRHQHQPKEPSVLHTTEHHFLLSPSQFQNFMNSPLFQQQASRRHQQQQPQPPVASNRNSVEPVAPPAGNVANKTPQDQSSSGPMRALRSLVSSQPGVVVDQEPQGSEVQSMRYLTNGPASGQLGEGLVVSEQQQQQQEAALASEPRHQAMLGQHQQQPVDEAQVMDQQVQESYGQMPAYQMAEGYGGGGQQYHHGGGGGGGGYGNGGGDHDKKSKGITFHFGGGPIGGGTQLITSPMGIFKHLMIPLLPNPRVNLNGKVVFGVVLEKSTAFGSPPKKKKYKFWGR